MATSGISYFNADTIQAAEGSELAAYQLWSGTSLVSPAAVFSFPVISDTDGTKERDQPVKNDEGGNEYALSGGKLKTELKFKTIQQDAATQDFSTTYANDTMLIFKKRANVQINGKYQFLIVPRAVVQEKTKLGKIQDELELNFKCETLSAQLVINPSLYSVVLGCTALTATALTLAAGDVIKFYEV